MKMNWGTGIVITCLLFMGFIVMLVVKTYQTKVDLVSEDYYKQELDFQNRINKMNNVTNENKIVWKIEQNELVFQFPKNTDSSLTGVIEFFRPSDASKDLRVPIIVDMEKSQHLRKELLKKGAYQVKIDWTANNKEYYMEEALYIK